MNSKIDSIFVKNSNSSITILAFGARNVKKSEFRYA